MSRNPYLITGPAVVSFSGGRTSAYMTKKVIDAHGGTLPEDVHVVFANTGKERPETLDFIQTASDRFGCHVTWLEYDVTTAGKPTFKVVDYATASRKGEPFERLIFKNTNQSGKAYLPNVAQRICTVEMKLRTIKRWMASQYDHWDNVVGIRHDEPQRVNRIRTREHDPRFDSVMPLDEAKVTKADVLAFFGAQDFDLKLRSWEGNCDLCFLKGTPQIMRMMRDDPSVHLWWADMEKRAGATFRKDRPSYLKLADDAQQPMLGFIDDESTLIDCVCGDDAD